MLDIAILGQVALGYSPFVDRNRSVSATRLTVFPLRPDAALDAAQLLHAIGGVWPASGGRVSLNVLSESLLQDLLSAQPSPNLMVEVPAFMAIDIANIVALQKLHAAGTVLLIKGRPLKELPRELLPCFAHAIIDLSDERRAGDGAAPAGVVRSISFVQSGVQSVADMESAFGRGAQAVLGWPIDDAAAAAARGTSSGKAAQQADLQTIVELIRRVDAQDEIEKIEATLKRDPALAFKLMRYINSPAFGLRVEISSFRHAIMMLGYQRLKRWLALLLATASRDVDMRPVMFAAVRRGLLMEELARSHGDEDMRGELFICGVFSLLDRMFRQPFAALLDTIPVPSRVYQALVSGTGPYQVYVDIVRAIEAGSLFDFREAAEAMMMSVTEINRATLRALTSASQLD